MNSLSRMRVFLADDHALMRAGIRSLLERGGVEVVGEASDGREAVESILRLRPDIALMDISMPELNGLLATEQLKKRGATTRVILLSMYANHEYVTQAFRVGAAGYILKDAATSELEFALAAVSAGETYVSPSVSRYLVDALKQQEEKPDPLSQLSERQREVLQMIAEGRSTKEIAFRLDISIKTVESHRAQLMVRLGIRDLSGLIRFAYQTGLVNVNG